MSTTSNRSVLDLPLWLEPSGGSQANRVHSALRRAILGGQLEAGLRLPSSRQLGEQLGVARNAVVVAYEHLQGDGLIAARHGSGTFVATHLPDRPAADTRPVFEPPALHRNACSLGRTHPDPLLMRQFATVMRRRIVRAREEDLAYGDPRGSEALRLQIAAHLAASRGIRCDPGCILVLGGTQQGLRLCAEALMTPGDAVWFEEPGYGSARRTLESSGLRPIPVPVDREGIDVAHGRLASADARAAYVTPSNQFPTGATLSMARRLALLDWARETDAWLLEDDYDNEFRYEGPPLTALAGLDGGERVIYLGTFSKTLFAGLRLAYMVLPPAVVAPVVTRRLSHDRFPPGLTQGAIADLMASGALAHHTRRMRRRYRSARDMLADALAEAAGSALEITVPPQGLHIVAWLPAGLPAEAARQIREEAGIEAWLVSENRIRPGPRDGFVLGFSGHGEEDLRQAAFRLGEAAVAHAENRNRGAD